ncbi:MAG: hypothetical protein AAB283_01565 [Planctomycetota bacterium]
MSKKSIILIFILILSPVLIYFLWPSDESRIKKLIKEGAAAVEKEEIDNVMSKVSFNYQDDRGMTYILIKKILTEQFKSLSGIKIEYENLKIEVKEKLANAEFDLRVIATIGNDTGYIIGDLKNPAHVRLALEKERVSWLVTKTEGLSF